MESRVKLAGHPVHPMLIAFPLGLLSTAVIFDILSLVTNATRWTEVAYYMIGAGLIGGALAAVPGWIDWAAIPSGTRARRVGLLHGLGNVVVLALFALSWVLRRPNPSAPPTKAIVAGLLGLVLVAITGWLGGELLDRLGVGVDDGAHLDSPSSLSALPAGAEAHGASRASVSGGAMSAAASRSDRRVYPPPAYAGVDRRAGASTR